MSFEPKEVPRLLSSSYNTLDLWILLLFDVSLSRPGIKSNLHIVDIFRVALFSNKKFVLFGRESVPVAHLQQNLHSI